MPAIFGLGYGELSIIFMIPVVIVIGIIFFIRAMVKSKASGNSKSDRLKELEKMRGEGLISEDEFSKKRNEIIGSV